MKVLGWARELESQFAKPLIFGQWTRIKLLISHVHQLVLCRNLDQTLIEKVRIDTVCSSVGNRLLPNDTKKVNNFPNKRGVICGVRYLAPKPPFFGLRLSNLQHASWHLFACSRLKGCYAEGDKIR